MKLFLVNVNIKVYADSDDEALQTLGDVLDDFEGEEWYDGFGEMRVIAEIAGSEKEGSDGK